MEGEWRTQKKANSGGPPRHTVHQAQQPATGCSGVQYLLLSGVCAEQERNAPERDTIAFKRFASSMDDNSKSQALYIKIIITVDIYSRDFGILLTNVGYYHRKASEYSLDAISLYRRSKIIIRLLKKTQVFNFP
jgi:hypothetical protein